ncbi:hypothetical protein [Porphyromonas pogonae]|uniref:hypothetical protein n=1 Tax=Porphyromonas pogonae TaxID=867595 RepID=UPI002E79C71D|nr:hypothetical protein [Porphyromonas pogonae]
MTKRESRKQRSNLPAMQRSLFVLLDVGKCFIDIYLESHYAIKREYIEEKECSSFVRNID